jgi:hypothetical protein
VGHSYPRKEVDAILDCTGHGLLIRTRIYGQEGNSGWIDVAGHAVYIEVPCPGGGIGRRKGLKIPRPQGRAGSTPAPGTKASQSMVLPADFVKLILSITCPSFKKQRAQKQPKFSPSPLPPSAVQVHSLDAVLDRFRHYSEVYTPTHSRQGVHQVAEKLMFTTELTPERDE